MVLCAPEWIRRADWGLPAASRLRPPDPQGAMRAGVDPARRTGGFPPLRGFAAQIPRRCAPEWIRRAARGASRRFAASPPRPPRCYARRSGIRRAALGGFPPLRGFAPQTPKVHARRSGSGAPHWGASRRFAASPPRPPGARAPEWIRRGTGGFPPLRGFAPQTPKVLCAPEWIRRAALGGFPPLRGFAPQTPKVLCAPEWIRRAALGGFPPLRGFAPQTRPRCHARRSGSGAPHWGLTGACGAFAPRPPSRLGRQAPVGHQGSSGTGGRSDPSGAGVTASRS